MQRFGSRKHIFLKFIVTFFIINHIVILIINSLTTGKWKVQIVWFVYNVLLWLFSSSCRTWIVIRSQNKPHFFKHSVELSVKMLHFFFLAETLFDLLSQYGRVCVMKFPNYYFYRDLGQSNVVLKFVTQLH